MIAERPTRHPANRRWRDWQLLMRFWLVGMLNTIFGYAVFALMLWFGVWSGAALVAAAVLGIAFNFQTSSRLVFGSRGHLVHFVAVHVVVLAINWTALRVLRCYGLSATFSQALLTLPVAAVSFVGQRRLVFSRAR